MDQMDSTSNQLSEEEQKQQALNFAVASLSRGAGKVGPMIDELTSADLKRVLKTITHFYFADSILNKVDKEKAKTKYKLSEKEQSLIDAIFLLQEDVLGYTQLIEELGLNNNTEESSEEEKGEEDNE